jgi:hypothetical protein
MLKIVLQHNLPKGDICSAAKMALGRWDDLFDHLVGAGE